MKVGRAGEHSYASVDGLVQDLKYLENVCWIHHTFMIRELDSCFNEFPRRASLLLHDVEPGGIVGQAPRGQVADEVHRLLVVGLGQDDG